MAMTRVPRGVLMTVAILALVAGTTFGILGCGSDGGSSDLVGPAEDIVLFPDDVSAAGLDTATEKICGELPGINLGTSGRFYSRSLAVAYVENHYFMTKAGVAYQVEIIAEGADANVDLYLGRNAHPYSTGAWKSSTRSYPLMDGIVFRSAQDGIMYVDVLGSSNGGAPGDISYRIHARKCQFGTFNQ